MGRGAHLHDHGWLRGSLRAHRVCQPSKALFVLKVKARVYNDLDDVFQLAKLLCGHRHFRFGAWIDMFMYVIHSGRLQ